MGSYDIAQFAERTGLTAHTLRYYEKEFIIQDVPRDAGGRRRYNDAHLRVVRFVNALRSTGMPIREIKRYLRLYLEGEDTRGARLQLLEDHRDHVKAQLEAYQESLGIIERKIRGYRRGRF